MGYAVTVQADLLQAEMMCFCIMLVLCFLLNIRSIHSNEVAYFIRVCRRTLVLCVAGLLMAFIEILTVTGRLPTPSVLLGVMLLYDAMCVHLPYSTYMDGERLLFPDKAKGAVNYLERALPFWLCIALIAMSAVTGSVRHPAYSGLGVEAGPLLWVVTAVQMYYSIALLMGPFRTLGRRKANREYYTPFEQALIMIAAGFPIVSLISGLFMGLSGVATGYTIALFFIIVTFQQRRSSMDQLTGLNNRNELRRHMRKMYEQSPHRLKDSYIIFADIDHFKSINDKYGHAEGDRALVRFSQMLTEAVSTCPNCFLCRYGGDEFLIVYTVKSEELVKELIDRITEICDRENRIADGKYQLLVSADYIRFRPEFKDFHSFVGAADKRMYEAKRENHAREAMSGED
ncbi:MAG: diguanylate cyclase domain-containing protein [Succinivibrio sp.]